MLRIRVRERNDVRGFSSDIVFPASPRDEQSDEKDCIRPMIRFSSIPNSLQKELRESISFAI